MAVFEVCTIVAALGLIAGTRTAGAAPLVAFTPCFVTTNSPGPLSENSSPLTTYITATRRVGTEDERRSGQEFGEEGRAAGAVHGDLALEVGHEGDRIGGPRRERERDEQ